jgi:Uma2 family endonuclease
MTEKEFENWCDEDTFAEWVDGEVVMMSPVNVDHADVFGFLYLLLGTFIDEQELGRLYAEPFQVRFEKLRRRRSPDLFFIPKGRKAIVEKIVVNGAPDLMVEIVSPTSQSRDRREKFLEYQAAGVREYWIVDPQPREVELYVLSGKPKCFEQIHAKDGWLKSTALPGFRFRPEWCWQMPRQKISKLIREISSGS